MLHFNWLQDIQLSGLGILHEHCQLDIEDNEVYVTPLAKTGYVYKQKKKCSWCVNYFGLDWSSPLHLDLYACSSHHLHSMFYSFHQHCMQGPHNSVGRALQHQHRGHGFKCCSSPVFIVGGRGGGANLELPIINCEYHSDDLIILTLFALWQ